MKEEAIETKLDAIESDWAARNLVRGVCVRVCVEGRMCCTCVRVHACAPSVFFACARCPNTPPKHPSTRKKQQQPRTPPTRKKKTFAEYKARGSVVLKAAETAELIEALEESQMSLGGMATNRYSAPFCERVGAWAGRLGTVSEVLEQWLAVQAMWQYMEAVFSGGDIVKQLPAEAKRFATIDKNFVKVGGGVWGVCVWCVLCVVCCVLCVLLCVCLGALRGGARRRVVGRRPGQHPSPSRPQSNTRPPNTPQQPRRS